MKLHLARPTAINVFTAYGEGYVNVNNERFEKSLVVLPERVISDWPATSFDALSAEQLETLAGLGADIVLLGTGNRLRFPRPELLRLLVKAGVGVEVMDIQAACRTYNILVAEERKVAAALLFD